MDVGILSASAFNRNGAFFTILYEIVVVGVVVVVVVRKFVWCPHPYFFRMRQGT
jgi:hypothetical protein